ncbi:hypothetical protein L596_024978 [Steinernema carpocapsae]|uniref:Uncharacterized protein n=1 Tax=Steinernema carpocapsae TaxID=34508 RepID=A0A4U5M6F1_STECR|nr:hypothetical protein L596_024978 [Steinernema carpocapsae]
MQSYLPNALKRCFHRTIFHLRFELLVNLHPDRQLKMDKVPLTFIEEVVHLHFCNHRHESNALPGIYGSVIKKASQNKMCLTMYIYVSDDGSKISYSTVTHGTLGGERVGDLSLSQFFRLPKSYFFIFDCNVYRNNEVPPSWVSWDDPVFQTLLSRLRNFVCFEFSDFCRRASKIYSYLNQLNQCVNSHELHLPAGKEENLVKFRDFQFRNGLFSKLWITSLIEDEEWLGNLLQLFFASPFCYLAVFTSQRKNRLAKKLSFLVETWENCCKQVAVVTTKRPKEITFLGWDLWIADCDFDGLFYTQTATDKLTKVSVSHSSKSKQRVTYCGSRTELAITLYFENDV